ncbi:MAG: hypothetical protein AAFX06_02110 [Planctomycetota bacterium]
MTCSRSNLRLAYTLLELIGAMAAASLLMLTLASSVLVATSLVEPSDMDGQLERNRLILDRLGHDLRYATEVDTKTLANGFRAARVDVQNTNQSITYQALADGLTRTVDGTQFKLDGENPTISHWVDGFTAATKPAEPSYLRPRACDVAVSTTPTNALTLEVPANAQSGDLLLLAVAVRKATSVLPFNAGWVETASIQHDNVHLVLFSQLHGVGTSSVQVVRFDEVDDATAALIVIEGGGATPITWAATQKGDAFQGMQSTFATPLQNSATIRPTSLNLQVFASDSSPWTNNTLAIPSFSDLLVSIGSEGTADEVMLGVTYRSGPIPNLSHSINAFHFESADWVSVSLQIDGS